MVATSTKYELTYLLIKLWALESEADHTWNYRLVPHISNLRRDVGTVKAVRACQGVPLP